MCVCVWSDVEADVEEETKGFVVWFVIPFFLVRTRLLAELCQWTKVRAVGCQRTKGGLEDGGQETTCGVMK